MKHHSLMISGFALFLMASMCQAQTARRWSFDRNGDRENWTIPADARGVVMGGSLWLTLGPKETDPGAMATTGYQAFGDLATASKGYEALRREKLDLNLASSPSGLQIPATEVTQVRLRVLNLSSLTDFYLRWRTKEQEWGGAMTDLADWGQPEPPHSRRCTLKADVKEWQEITCHIDQRWQGTIDQIAILSAQRMLRGNLWIDWIEIRKGPPEPIRARPDVASGSVVPKITLPGISQTGFHDAFRVLDECLTIDVPIYGFNYPVMSPGGYYTKGGWWLLDSSLNVTGAKWTNQRFAEDVMRGFRELQAENPDGRIDLTGQHGVRGQVADLSQLPMFFEVAYDVARRTDDGVLREQIYETMRKFLDWWLSPVKRDARTGLVSAIFEETLGNRSLGEPMTLAPVDLNVVVAAGALRTFELATTLGKAEEANRYRQAFQDLSRAINAYLWDDKEGVYSNYDLRERKAGAGLNVTTFDPLRLGIAPAARRDRLLKRLLDPAQFNWGKRPLTSWAMTDPGYVEATGDYDGRAWFGDIWTLRNMTIVEGLEESRRPDLAAELNWATIQAFHSNYREYLLPSTGEGQGAQNYGISASQYIGAIIEHLFGVDFDRIQKRVKITPHVPEALYGKDLALENLILPTEGDTRLSVLINQSAARAAKITVRISGALPEGTVQVALPGGAKQITMPAKHSITAEFP